MSGRSRRSLRLVSSRVRQASLRLASEGSTSTGTTSTDNNAMSGDSSEDDFEEPVRSNVHARPFRKSTTDRSNQVVFDTATERVERAVQRGLSVIRDGGHGSFPAELGDRFPFLNHSPARKRSRLASSSAKRTRILAWKTVPFCLPDPTTQRVPMRSVMDVLCREGLGTLWFNILCCQQYVQQLL